MLARYLREHRPPVRYAGEASLDNYVRLQGVLRGLLGGVHGYWHGENKPAWPGLVRMLGQDRAQHHSDMIPHMDLAHLMQVLDLMADAKNQPSHPHTPVARHRAALVRILEGAQALEADPARLAAFSSESLGQTPTPEALSDMRIHHVLPYLQSSLQRYRFDMLGDPARIFAAADKVMTPPHAGLVAHLADLHNAAEQGAIERLRVRGPATGTTPPEAHMALLATNLLGRRLRQLTGRHEDV